MRFLIIESHPYEQSFNTNAAEMIRKILTSKSYTVDTINLIEDKFDPTVYTDDLKLWNEGKTKDKLVEKYQNMITNSDTLIIPFPVWWGSMPAILRGFWDKVLLPGWAYNIREDGSLYGLIKGKKAIVITTMSAPLSVFNDNLQNPIRGAFIKNTLEVCGFEVLKHFEIEKIDLGHFYTDEKMLEIKHFFNGLN